MLCTTKDDIFWSVLHIMVEAHKPLDHFFNKVKRQQDSSGGGELSQLAHLVCGGADSIYADLCSLFRTGSISAQVLHDSINNAQVRDNVQELLAFSIQLTGLHAAGKPC